METVIYFVRHADAPFVEGQERERGLSRRGRLDALKIQALLESEGIEVLISSPYERARQTISPLAATLQQRIEPLEDLRERRIGQFEPLSFDEAKRKVFEQPDFAFPGGESTTRAQARAGTELYSLLARHAGKKIVIATHGDIMTLIMNLFDPQYDYDFWKSTTMPDIYKLTLKGQKLKQVKRLWEPANEELMI